MSETIYTALGLTKDEAIEIAVRHNPFRDDTTEWSEYIKKVMADETLTLAQRGYAMFMAGQAVEHAHRMKEFVENLMGGTATAKKEAKDAIIN